MISENLLLLQNWWILRSLSVTNKSLRFFSIILTLFHVKMPQFCTKHTFLCTGSPRLTTSSTYDYSTYAPTPLRHFFVLRRNPLTATLRHILVMELWLCIIEQSLVHSQGGREIEWKIWYRFWRIVYQLPNTNTDIYYYVLLFISFFW